MIQAGFLLTLVLAAWSGWPTLAQTPSGLECKQLLVLFARGSGQNSGTEARLPNEMTLTSVVGDEEHETHAFFKAIEARIGDETSVGWQSLYNFPGGDPTGYTAVGGLSKLFTGYVEEVEVDWDAFPISKYQRSVRSGANEASSYLNFRASHCKNERYILGGYSQGAHVMGNALFDLNSYVYNRIAFVALFGDPKFDNGTKEALWPRGSFDWTSRGGILGSRSPYVLDSLSRRIGSWCDRLDPICAGKRAFVLAGFTEDAHYEYPNEEIQAAANEIAVRLKDVFGPSGDDLSVRTIVLKGGRIPILDLAFVIDTTGSMIEDLESAKANARSLAERVLSLSPETRVCLVQYRDHGDAFVAETEVPFTSSASNFIAGLERLEADGGGDTREAVLSGLAEAFSQDWRDGAAKVAVVIGDAAGKDPEPITGYTNEEMLQRARDLDPVSIYSNVTSDSDLTERYFAELGSGSGGRVYPLGDEQLAATLQQTLKAIRLSPVASAGGPYVGRPGEPIQFTAAASFDPDGAPSLYEWDFDTDGVTDITSDSPIVRFSYADPYEGLASLRVTGSSGDIGQASAQVSVTAEARIDPEPPPVATARVEGPDVLVDWTRPTKGPEILGYSVSAVGGRLLAVLPPDREMLKIRDVPRTNEFAFEVRTIGELGESRPATTNTVHVGGPLGMIALIGGGLLLLFALAGGAAFVMVQSRKSNCPVCGSVVGSSWRVCSTCRYPLADPLRFQVIAGPEAGELLVLKHGDVLGAGPTVSKPLRDPTISAEHASIEWTGDAWLIRDLGSSAGILRNGEEILQARVRLGDRVTLGETELLVDG